LIKCAEISGGRGLAGLYVIATIVVLGGYAALGKGFAYLGIPPFYVAEGLLVLGLVAAVATLRSWSVFGLVVLAWLGLTLVHLAASFPAHGMLAARDAAATGYALFAVFMAGVLRAQPDLMKPILRALGSFALLYPLVALLLVLLTQYGGDRLPRVLGSPVPLLHVKAGDAGVLLCIAVAACVAIHRRVSTPMAALLVLTLLIFALLARASFLSFAAGMAVFLIATCNVLRVWREVFRVVAVATVVMLALHYSDAWLVTERHGRSIEQRVSPTAVVYKFEGVLIGVLGENWRGGETASALGAHLKLHDSNESEQQRITSSTVAWRLSWWRTITEKTLTGERWYRGRGLGVNLADEDGFQVTSDGSLRSPHNIFMSHLAWTGLPGVLMFVAVLGVWVYTVAGATWHAAKTGRRDWQLLLAVALAGWSAALVNACFDVYLEGPMGAVWFWSLSGVGLAAASLARDWRHPPLLDDRCEPRNSRTPPRA